MASELLGYNNNCWFCSHKNTSWATECDRCHGLTISTKENNIDVERIKSYSSSRFNKVEADLLFLAMKSLRSEEEASAIKIETGPSQAADGSVNGQGPTLITQILIVKTQTEKRFTVGTRTSEERYPLRDLENREWGTDQPGFWEMVNQILNLDVHSPGWRQQVGRDSNGEVI